METEIPVFFKETERNLEKLVVLLEQEKKELAKKNYTEADTIIEKKNALFTKLEEVNQQISDYMSLIRIPRTHQALSKYISQRLPSLQGHLLLRQWQNIIELLAQAESLNIENGMMMSSAKELTKNTVDTLLAKIRTNIYLPEEIKE